MRFKQLLKTTAEQAELGDLMSLFERAAYTLGFSTLGTSVSAPMDVEAAVTLMTYLAAREDLRLSRFTSVLMHWLSRYHHLLNAQKLLKMGKLAESILGQGELPLFRLASHALKKMDHKKFKNFSARKLKQPFYVDPRLSSVVDHKLQEEGFYLGLTKSTGLMIPAGSFPERSSDLLSEEVFLKRNEQLRLRLLMGVGYRSDAVWLLNENANMSAREMSHRLLLSYEPAHRLATELRRYLAYDLSLKAESLARAS